jgi:hypothetical protein
VLGYDRLVAVDLLQRHPGQEQVSWDSPERRFDSGIAQRTCVPEFVNKRLMHSGRFLCRRHVHLISHPANAARGHMRLVAQATRRVTLPSRYSGTCEDLTLPILPTQYLVNDRRTESLQFVGRTLVDVGGQPVAGVTHHFLCNPARHSSDKKKSSEIVPQAVRCAVREASAFESCLESSVHVPRLDHGAKG